MVTYENKGFRFLPRNLIIFTLKIFDRLSVFLVQLKIHPNYLSLTGFLAGLLVGLFYALGYPVWALVFLVISGIMDILDGKVATNGNKKTRFGAIFDAVSTAISICLYLGLGFYFPSSLDLWVLACLSWFDMVCYTKARADGLGFQCQLGIMQRGERMGSVILGTLLSLIINLL
jgi:CDP-diacylglycerol--glycerol-3-phosphate 3-phosphatidyltransferase